MAAAAPAQHYPSQHAGVSEPGHASPQGYAPQHNHIPQDGYAQNMQQPYVPAHGVAPIFQPRQNTTRGTGIFQQCMAVQPTSLMIKERVMSLSSDNFEIYTVDGKMAFKVAGKYFSLSGRKELYDSNNKHLFTIRKRHLTIHTTFYLEDPAGKEILEAKSSFAMFGSKFTARFTSLDGRAVELKLKCNFFDTAQITDANNQNLPLAQINRIHFKKRDLFLGQQVYELIVYPGVDMSLMVAMCICLDEKKNEGS
ncbi:DUF567-domain-containing protein [Pseudovirgaria hyperparasitica]|uniref:DUF567-domain-containing protein n=1 Tax=Pseudovirgaria hyperparasitica TaxID=470096 RepID=A0A6A6VYM9_9PEZI|nr:DUF567-domain-containing protein [Pseudovirgaria hyperparasitica]KAF2755383.1 DUF567-domain-containing protein [Pseudovirgaria hyperparasitica]